MPVPAGKPPSEPIITPARAYGAPAGKNGTHPLPHGGKSSPTPGRPERDNRAKRVKRDFPGVVGGLVRYLGDYVVLPEQSVLVTALWVVAAHLTDAWDKFPHLAVTSPEKRCGKTTLLDLLYHVTPNARYTTNISPAALYRVIQKERPTLLMDESQSIARRGSEATEVIREILNAGIGKNAKVIRCGGANHDQVEEFSVYSPKVFALIGELDSVLADRCVPVRLERKTRDDSVQRYRSRVVGKRGDELRAEVERWAMANRKRVAAAYDRLEPFGIDNDRMAELLLPLQSVMTVAAPGQVGELEGYAEGLDERDREMATQTPGVRLLSAVRDLFGETKASFLGTGNVIVYLIGREDGPWARWNRGEPITAEKVAGILRPYGVRPVLNQKLKPSCRGFYRSDFEEAWGRYLPPTPGKPV